MWIKINSIWIDDTDKALKHTEVLSFIKKECMNKIPNANGFWIDDIGHVFRIPTWMILIIILFQILRKVNNQFKMKDLKVYFTFLKVN